MRSLLVAFFLAIPGVASAAYPLSVTLTGSGYGYVTSSPAGINCPGTCSADFEPGTVVTLYAYGSYAPGVFMGACNGWSCTITMDGPKSVTASFNVYIEPILTFTSVSKSGTGSGTVTAPPSINCGSVCTGSYFNTDTVTLTATAAPGSVFTGWSGGGCEGVMKCITKGGNSVTATFNLGTPTARPVNVSTRGRVETGFGVMIGGFVINGATSKTVVVRAIGPSLEAYGINGFLYDPVLQLVRVSDNAVIASNDNWESGPDAAKIRAAGLGPGHAYESAVWVNIPAGPGAYTAIVSGANGGTGVGLVEVYEVDHPETPIVNLSTRGTVQGGFESMIGGFVILDGPETVIVRAIGPSLANYGVAGVLADPTMQLVRMNDNTVVATNDNWQSAGNAAQVAVSGFAPSNPLESAILVTLQPGAYTAVVSGVGGATGVGLIEVYRVAQ